MLDLYMTIVGTCPVCGEEWEVDVDFDGYIKYKNGALVQDAFPYLEPSVRELLISGICDKCYTAMFSFFDEECEEEDIFACECESLGERWW